MKIMHHLIRSTLVGVVIVLSGTTNASAQSIYGPGGLFLNPTADSPAKGQITPAALAIPQDGPGLVGGQRTLTSYSLSYGATDRLEVGVTHLRLNPTSGAFSEASNGGFVKYRLVEGRPGKRPDIAIGASALGGGSLDARTAFVALRFTPRDLDPRHPMHFHGGILYADKLYGFNRDTATLYGGVDYGITRKLTAFAEIRSKMSAKPSQFSDVEAPSAYGLVYQLGRGMKIAIAYANNGQSRDRKLSAGIGFTLGSRRGGAG